MIGSCDNNLEYAIAKALRVDRKAAAIFARRFTWENATDQFVAAIESALRTRKPATAHDEVLFAA